MDEMEIMRLYLKGTLVVAVVIAADALADITMVAGTSFVDAGVTTAKVAIGPCTNHGKSLFHFVFGWLRRSVIQYSRTRQLAGCIQLRCFGWSRSLLD